MQEVIVAVDPAKRSHTIEVLNCANACWRRCASRTPTPATASCALLCASGVAAVGS